MPALVLTAACQAGSIQLTPLRINLSAAATVAALTVSNAGTEDSVMQVTLHKWTLEAGLDVYQRSQDLVIMPSTFRLTPGAQQIVRIALRDAAAAPHEGSYRMLVEEVPPPLTRGRDETRLVVRHDLPVFVAPQGAAQPALEIGVECTGGSRLRVTNTGNVHAQLRSVVLENVPGKQVLARWETAAYLLPGAQKSWDLAQAAPEAAGKRFVVTTVTDQGAFSSSAPDGCA